MVKGERDYSQRVIATMRPSGIIGGREIFFEDFESLPEHYTHTPLLFSVTTTDKEVFTGDGAGKFTLAAGQDAYLQVNLPPATPDVYGIEVLFRPLDYNLQYFAVASTVYTGTKRYRPGVQALYDGTNSLLQIVDSAYTAKTIATLGTGALEQGWHILYMRFNMGTGFYEMAQCDSTRLNIATEPLESTDYLSSPYLNFQLFGKALSSGASSVSFDNLYLLFEEL